MVQGWIEPDRTPQLPPGFDPNKWVFDTRTNEFHKVTNRIAGTVLINLATHEKRYNSYLQKAIRARRDRIMTLIAWPIFLLSLLWMFDEPNPLGKIGIFVFFVMTSGLFAILGSVGVIYNSFVALPMAKANIGPPPPPRPGREVVEQQKVHGEGGVLGGDRLRQAARGGSLAKKGAAPLDTYDD